MPVYMPCLAGHKPETVAFTQGDSNVFLTKIGYDYFSHEEYHLMINMNCSEMGNEFMFGIATSSRDKGRIETTFDSNKANDIIPKSHRSSIMQVLLEQAEKVVKYTNVDAFFMVTYLYGLPDKALVKYDKLNDVFERCGYAVTHSEPDLGKHMWEMNRTGVSPLSSGHTP